MYKLVIVDDEVVIRQGLAELVAREDLGFELVASFGDGRETLEYLKEHEVDVVLTDICMSEVSGMSLSGFIYRNMPEVKVVIISGYKEFEYAKQAVEYNVMHYLLKPTDYDEIVRVFTELKEKLDQEKNKKLKDRELLKRYQDMIPLIEEQFFTDLMMGGLWNSNELTKRLKLMNLDISPDNSACLIFSAGLFDLEGQAKDKWSHGKERLHIAIRNFFRNTKDNVHYFPLHQNNQIKIIAITKIPVEVVMLKQAAEKRLMEISGTVKELLGLNLTIQLDRSFTNLIELSRYTEPLILNEADILTDEGFNMESAEYQQMVQKYRLFASYINDGDEPGLMGLLDSLMEDMTNIKLKFVQRLIIDLFAILFNKFSGMGYRIDEELFRKVDYHYVTKIKNMRELKKWSKEALVHFINYIERHKQNAGEVPIKQALRYIDKNFNKDISLEDVAGEVFLNAVYLSRLFKQATGENFIDYITKIRMEKAIEMMEKGRYKIYELSEMVGYGSSKYFARVFKQHTGYAPKDYIRIVVKKGDAAVEK